MSGGEALYREALLRHAVPVLSLLDRERLSPTFGCLDRTWWAWKFSDFPGSRFQEGLCYLSFLHAWDFEGSPYHQNPELLGWIAGGFDFWAGRQRRAGDFDEAYPFEHSLAATAFTGFYLAEAHAMLAGGLPPQTDARFREALRRVGDWLVRNDEHHGILSNHLAAAAAACLHAHRVCGEERFLERGREFLGRILEHQSKEGWYREYAGADPGYQTHGSFYLERCLELRAQPGLADSLDRSYRFLAHFVHPDGSLGGEYASRNTQTYYPAAFEMAASRSGAAAWIAERMRGAVATRSAAGLETVDLYNRFPLLNNVVFAYRALRAGRPPAPAAPPPETPACLHFPEAGLAVLRRPRLWVAVGLHKGGVVKAFDRSRGHLLLSDCGYVGRRRGGARISTQWLDAERSIEVGQDELVVRGRFVQVSRPVFDPYRFAAFRLFSLSLGRLAPVARWLKALLVRVLVTRRRELDLRFERRIRVGDAQLEIEDRLQGKAADLVELRQEDVFTTIHMGSSRYFIPHELEPRASRLAEEERRVAPGELATGVLRIRRARVGPEA